MDLTEAEGIKKRWQEYTDEWYKRDLHEPDDHNGVIHQPRARLPGMRSHVGLRKQNYKQN